MKRNWIYGAAAILLIIAVVSFVKFLMNRPGSSSEETETKAVVEVRVTKPLTVSDSLVYEAQGKVTAKTAHSISALSEGKVRQVLVSPGEEVKKGRVLAILENKELDNELAVQKEKLNLALKNSESMEQKAKNSREMLSLGIISESDMTSVNQELNRIKSEEHDQQNNYDMLSGRVKNYRVISDTDGYISDIVPEESFVTYGQKVADIISLGDEQIEAYVPFGANEPKPGDEAFITCNNIIVSGKVSNNFPSASSNLIKVVVIPEKPVPMNLDVKVTFKVSGIKGLMIPKTAVVMVEGKPVIYVVRDGKAIKTEINVEKDYLDRILLSGGIGPDDNIVTENAYLLSDSVSVKVK